MRKLIFLLLVCIPALAAAVPPPPVQVTADCDNPVYASDVLVCEDAGLRVLDGLLASKIAERHQRAPDNDDQDWFRRSRLCAFETDHRECLSAAYCLRLALLDRGAGPAGCKQPADAYIAASAISKNGFASSLDVLEPLLGRETGVWGFVDQQNIYADDDARAILGDWWSGYSPNAASWQFKLKARADDGAGRSLTVNVPNDMLRNDVLRVFVRDASEGRPTKVYLLGVLATFEAPLNTGTLHGLSMDLQSSGDIHPAVVETR